MITIVVGFFFILAEIKDRYFVIPHDFYSVEKSTLR